MRSRDTRQAYLAEDLNELSVVSRQLSIYEKLLGSSHGGPFQTLEALSEESVKLYQISLYLS